MKTISKHIIVTWVIYSVGLPFALCQEVSEKYGFIRIANAVAPGMGAVSVEIDGVSTHADGYQLGDITGGISTSPGKRRVIIRRNGTENGVTTVEVKLNDTTVLIPFAEWVPAAGTQKSHWAIRILRLKQRDPLEERSATFVSVSRTPELKIEMREPSGKWHPVLVKRLSLVQTPIFYPRGYAPVRCRELKLESIPVGEPGNYVVLLYDDEAGKLSSINFRDFRFLNVN